MSCGVLLTQHCDLCHKPSSLSGGFLQFRLVSLSLLVGNKCAQDHFVLGFPTGHPVILTMPLDVLGTI